MRILILHNRYRYRGGEDVVVDSEQRLLEAGGNVVQRLEFDNRCIGGLREMLRTAMYAVYSPTARRMVSAQIAAFRPDLVHIHNFFPLVSPSAYFACSEAGVPAVQTLHNYRILCPNPSLTRRGVVCESCLGRIWPWPALLHGCYRQSHAATVPVVAMITVHRLLRTWNQRVQVFIVPSEYVRQCCLRGGLPKSKLVVKPNFVHDPGVGTGTGNFILFVGRLSPEKGLRFLIETWAARGVRVPLKVIGEGPLADFVRESQQVIPELEYLGKKSVDEVLQWMGMARAVVLPSRIVEALPRSMIEAFAKGTPVIASCLGPIEGLVDHRRTGLLFEPGNATDLENQLQWMLAHPDAWQVMRREARREYETKYTAELNYAMLMAAYQQALHSCPETEEGFAA